MRGYEIPKCCAAYGWLQTTAVSRNGELLCGWDTISLILTILYRHNAARRFTACWVGRFPTGCSTSSHTGHRLSHPTENIYESYYCVQMLTIPTAVFLGWTAPVVPALACRMIWIYIHSAPSRETTIVWNQPMGGACYCDATSIDHNDNMVA